MLARTVLIWVRIGVSFSARTSVILDRSLSNSVRTSVIPDKSLLLFCLLELH